jgi:hypothetical protein
MSNTVYDRMIGLTMKSVEENVDEEVGNQMTFESECGKVFTFYHEQDCCEHVRIEDVCGDLSDLVGSPLLVAEEVTNSDEYYELEPKSEGTGQPYDDDYYGGEVSLWTFYKFATVKGSVTVRWVGTSNGYYSMGVDYSESVKSSEE